MILLLPQSLGKLAATCCCCLVAKLWPTLCDPMDCGLPGFSVHGISQTSILEWVAISFSMGSSWPRDWTHISCLVGKFFLSLNHLKTNVKSGQENIAHNHMASGWVTRLRRRANQSSQQLYFLVHSTTIFPLLIQNIESISLFYVIMYFNMDSTVCRLQ